MIPKTVLAGILAFASVTCFASDPKPAAHGAEKKEEKKTEKKPAEGGHGEAKAAAKSEHGAKPEAKAASSHGEAKPTAQAEVKPTAAHVEAKPKAVAAIPRPRVQVRPRPIAPAAAPRPADPLPAALASGQYVLVPTSALLMMAQGQQPAMGAQLVSTAAASHGLPVSASDNHAPAHTAAHPLPPAVTPVVSAEEALDELKKGNMHHVESDYDHDHHSHSRLVDVAKGQKPHAIVLTCSDSRVPPELVFDKGLGDLFVIRVAGNVAGESELASIEYAAEHLNVPLVIVMGHKRCGAVQAAAAGGDPGGHITALVHKMDAAITRARELGGELVDTAVHTNIDQVVRDLRNNGPILKELVGAGRLKVLGAYYDLDSGKVEWMY